MNPLKNQTTEELIFNAFERKVADIAVEKINAILNESYKLINDQICDMFDENADPDVVMLAVENICDSVERRISQKLFS